MLETRDLSFNYNTNQKFDFPDVKVSQSESLLLLGKSGIGKTTLLHLLAGLMKPVTGKIIVDNQDITQLDGRSLDIFRGQNIGIIFQQNHFIDSLTVIENIIIAQSLSGRQVDKNRALTLLSRLGLENKKNKKTSLLSQGERQRVAIARAIINNPKLILADEPTSALDDDNCAAVYHLLEEQAKAENATLVVVTHDTRLKDQVSKQIILQ